MSNERIDQLIEKELERRSAVRAISEASPAFIAALVKSIEEALKHIASRVSIPAFKMLPQKGRIVISNNHEGQEKSEAVIKIKSHEMLVSFSATEHTNYDGWQVPIEADEGSICYPGRTQDSTIEMLTMRVLVPLVFSGLKKSVTDRYLD